MKLRSEKEINGQREEIIIEEVKIVIKLTFIKSWQRQTDHRILFSSSD